MSVPTLPEPLGRSYEHLDLQAKGTWLVIGDLQIPFHDVTTIKLAVDLAAKEKVAGVLLNGDVTDFHEISKFDRRPADPPYKEELLAARQFLNYLRYRLPKARIVYKEGNHEERLYTYLFRNCRELWDLDELSLPSLLHFAKHGIEHVGERQVMMLGKLHVLHGHEYTFAISNPVNPARGLFLRAKGNSICSHFHQKSEHIESTIDGSQIGCWSIGCACGLKPYWFRLNKWANGFAMVSVSGDGTFSVRNYQVLDGKIV
jgi:predicted phosphodiesterase